MYFCGKYSAMENPTELFDPKEMQSPFDAIKQTDKNGTEWWNSRKLAQLIGYQKYWNFERLIAKVTPFLQKEKGLDLKEHIVEIEEMAQLHNSGYRKVTSMMLSRTACLAIVMNANQKKPLVKAAKDYFTDKMTSTDLASSIEGNVLMYHSSTGKVNVTVLFNNETFWLSQKRMAELFAVSVQDISYHLIQINESGELQLSTAVKKILIPSDNCDNQGVLMYNLDAVIAVGYRVNSYEATQFRCWATEVLKQYILKGFVMDDERLKGLNLISTAFLDVAEDRAQRQIFMKMADWKQVLEGYLKISDYEILENAGTVSHEEAEAKALGEYEKYRKIQDQTFLSDFDKFIQSLEQP